jgi:hypothetical protein
MSVHISHTSWGGRMSSALGGMCCGFLLFMCAFPLLFWNEQRSVQVEQSLTEARSAVVEVDSSARLLPSLTGRLIHASGELSVGSPAADPAFGIRMPNALRTSRTPEAWVNVERAHTTTTKTMGGGEERRTTYSYETVWSRQLVDSSAFHDLTAGRRPNPRTWAVQPLQSTASRVMLGPFKIDAVLGSLGTERPVDVLDEAASELGSLTASARAGASLPAPGEPAPVSALVAAAGQQGRALSPALAKMTVFDNALYTGSALQPVVGDVRVTWMAAVVERASVLGRQVAGGVIAPFVASNGLTVLLAEEGDVPAEAMIQHAFASNNVQMWLLRGAGWMAMAVGLLLIGRPATVAPELVPFVGGMLSGLVGCGVGIAALVAATCFALVTVAIAWLAARPFMAVGLLAAAAGLFVAGRAAWPAGRPQAATTDDKRD